MSVERVCDIPGCENEVITCVYETSSTGIQDYKFGIGIIIQLEDSIIKDLCDFHWYQLVNPEGLRKV